MGKLKPCRYCGNENYSYQNYGSDGKRIVCNNCGVMTSWKDSIAKVEKEWNTRIEVMNENNPFCNACKEEHCEISNDGKCEMIRQYLKGKKKLDK